MGNTKTGLKARVVPLALALAAVILVCLFEVKPIDVRWKGHRETEMTSCDCVRRVESTSETGLLQETRYDSINSILPGYGNISSRFDFTGPCDVAGVLTSLYDRAVPLTVSVLKKLRGCSVLLFFRSPRTGSTAVYRLICNLAKELNYSSIIGDPTPDLKGADNWISYINEKTTKREPVAVSKHTGAIDIIRKPKKPAVMINLVRQPVEHVISIFKLYKYGDKKAFNKARCNMTFSEYVLTRGIKRPCIPPWTGLRYACATCKGCRAGEACLNEAKKNAESLYLALGISDNISGFLFLMETLLPQFFHNALKQYVNMRGLYKMFSPDVGRNETLTAEAESYLNKELAFDIEFYHFVQQRFYISLKKALEFNANNRLNKTELFR